MELFVVAACVGVLVGVLSGLLGIGGGTIMVPLFRLVFSLEPIMATATSLFTIVPTSVSGLFKHMRNRTVLPALGILCGVAGACASPVGVWLATLSENWMIMTAAACVMAYSAITMFQKALASPRKKREDSSADGAAAGAPASGPSAAVGAAGFSAIDVGSSAPAGAGDSAAAAPAPEPALDAGAYMGASWKGLSASFVAKALVIGVVAGLLGGYVGVGGGFIMIPLFVALLGIPMKLASGTSLTAVCLLAIPGVVEQALLGNINYSIGIAMAAGSIPGAYLGASVVKHVPERALRLIFACFLLVMAAIMVANEIGLLG